MIHIHPPNVQLFRLPHSFLFDFFLLFFYSCRPNSGTGAYSIGSPCHTVLYFAVDGPFPCANSRLEPGRRHHTATQTATYRTAKVEKRIDYSDGPILSTSPITRNGNLDMPLAIPLEAINWCRVNENRMTLLQKFFILNQGAFYQYTSFFFSIPTIIFFCYFASSSSFVCSFFSCILQQPLDNLTKCRNSLVVPISTC